MLDTGHARDERRTGVRGVGLPLAVAALAALLVAAAVLVLAGSLRHARSQAADGAAPDPAPVPAAVGAQIGAWADFVEQGFVFGDPPPRGPRGRQLQIPAVMVLPVSRDFGEAAHGAYPDRRVRDRADTARIGIYHTSEIYYVRGLRREVRTTVGADVADIRYRAAVDTSAPMPIPDWRWQGNPVGDAACGKVIANGAGLMHLLHKCFLGDLSRGAGPAEETISEIEAVGRAWVARCDDALAWADAPEEPTIVSSLDTQLTGRLVGDIHVCSLKDLAAALEAEVSFDKIHEVVTVTRGDREITLYVGLRQLDVGGETSELGFPSLQTAVDDLIVDTFGVAEALGLGEEVGER